MIRRRIVLVYWVVAITLFVPGAAYAYIDPATTTYLIQIITALVVTVGVSLSVFLYKLQGIFSEAVYRIRGFFYRRFLYRPGAKRERGGAGGRAGRQNAEAAGGQNAEAAGGAGDSAGNYAGDISDGLPGGRFAGQNAETAGQNEPYSAGQYAEATGQHAPYAAPAFVRPGSNAPPDITSFDEKYREALVSSKMRGAAVEPVDGGPARLLGMAILVSQAGMAGQASMAGQAGTAGQEGIAGQEGMAGRAGMIGQADVTDRAGMLDQAGTAGQERMTGRTGRAGQAGMACQAGRADQAVIANRAGIAGLAPQKYIERMRMSAPVVLAISLSFILIGCMDLALQNSMDMPFRPERMAPVLLLASGLCFAVLLFLIPLFRGKGYTLLVSLALAILIAGYIQGDFMNGSLGELNGEVIYWDRLWDQTAGSLFMWALVITCVFLLLRFAKKAWLRLLFFVPLLLLVMQAAGFAETVDDYKKSGETSFWVQSKEMLTIEGLHSPASEKNAIIFVLDRMDNSFVDQIAINHPGFFDELDGFTRFDDNITYSASTFPSVTEMLTGNRYRYDRSRNSYFDFAWSNAEMLSILKERGVDTRLYTSRGYVYNSTSQLNGLVSNVNAGKHGGDIDFNKRIALVKLIKLSAFRYAPTPAKQAFWISPTEFNDSLLLTDATVFYLINDFAFYDNITINGLTPSGADAGFFFYHLQGAHEPINMNENIEWIEVEPEDRTAQRIGQATGCFKIVYEYLRQLKALGLYEDATIIITADHPDYLGDDLEKPMLAALFVKPASSAGTPLAYSHAPVCPDQLPATILEGLFGGSVGGNAGESDKEGASGSGGVDSGGSVGAEGFSFAPGYMDVAEGADVVREYIVRRCRYEIKGDGRDFANWSFIEEFPDTWAQ